MIEVVVTASVYKVLHYSKSLALLNTYLWDSAIIILFYPWKKKKTKHNTGKLKNSPKVTWQAGVIWPSAWSSHHWTKSQTQKRQVWGEAGDRDPSSGT